MSSQKVHMNTLKTILQTTLSARETSRVPGACGGCARQGFAAENYAE